MAHGLSHFRKRDLKTALATIREAGVRIAGVRFHKGGGFEVVIGDPINGNDETCHNIEGRENEWNDAKI